MTIKSTILGLSLPRVISLLTFLLAIISIWVLMEIRLAELNVEITNLKKNLFLYKADKYPPVRLAPPADLPRVEQVIEPDDEDL